MYPLAQYLLSLKKVVAHNQDTSRLLIGRLRYVRLRRALALIICVASYARPKIVMLQYESLIS